MIEQNSAEAEKLIEGAEEAFTSLMKQKGIKYKSVKFYDAQHAFFSGAIMILSYVPPKWGVSLIGRREIVQDYGKTN